MALAQAASSRSRQDSELSPVISSMGPSSRQQTAHRPAPGRSSRTPKRIKATPPTRPLGACTSTTANNISEDTRAGNSDTVMKDGVKPPKLHLKSPWKSPAWSGEREPRRKRENTVPMLSQTLSHFSLSQTPPHAQDSPGRPEPRRGNASIPAFPSFSSDGPEPASPSAITSAPAPYTHLFLASPFTRRGQDVPESSKQAQSHEAFRRWQASMPAHQTGSSLESPTHSRYAAISSTATVALTPSTASLLSNSQGGSPAFRPRRPPLAMFPKHSRDSSISPPHHWHNGPPIASAPLPGPGSKARNFFESKPVRRATSSVDLDLEAEEFFFHSKPPSRASSHSPSQILRRQDSDDSMASAYSSSNDETASSDPSTLPTSTFILPSPLPLLAQTQPLKSARPKLERRSQSERTPLGSFSDEDCEMLDSYSPSVSSCRKTRANSDPKRMVANIFAPKLLTKDSTTGPSPFHTTPFSEDAYSRSSSLAASSACKAAPAFSPNLFAGAFDTPGTMAETSSANASLPSPSPTPASALRSSQQGRVAVVSPERRNPAVSGAHRAMMPRRLTASSSGTTRSSYAETKPIEPPLKQASQIPRPSLRRGITEPQASHKAMTPVTRATVHKINQTFATPPVFTDEKPSPAAFASTGLIKKRGAFNMVKSSLQLGSKTEGKHTMLASLKICTPDTPIKTATTTPAGLAASRIPQRVQQTHSWVSSASSNSETSRTSSGHSRGLRRKGSAMWSASGGSGSWSGEIFEPVTPSRQSHGMMSSPGFLTTPSPPAPMRVYPFAVTPARRSRHPALPSSPTSATSPTEAFGPRNNLLRRIQPRPGPIARASNPLLSAAYKAGAVAASGCSGGFASPSLRSPSNGTTGRLERDFVILDVLGRGEFSDVLKVKEKRGGGLWAVKRGRRFAGFKDRLRQLQEVAILRQLSLQPNGHILRYVDSWEQNEQLHIRTELVDCGDLASFLEAVGDSGGLGETRVWKMLAELSTAISIIHDHNFIHLDLKPANILVTADGSLKIADFGMSARTSAEGLAVAVSPPLPSEGDNGNFTWGAEVDSFQELEKDREGDRAYLAPEGLSEGRFGRESDIFSLGIMILEAALNVVLPENGDGWRQLRSDDFSDIIEHYLPIEDRKVQDKETTLPQLSQTLLSLIKRMMSSEPASRPTIHEICNHPIIRLLRKQSQSADLQDWTDTECDEPSPSQTLPKAGKRLAGPALVPENNIIPKTLLGSN